MGIHNEPSAQESQATDTQEPQQAAMSREAFNVANEKLLEDQLQISEDKVVDYVPGKN